MSTKHTTIREFINDLEALAAEHGDTTPVFTVSRAYEEHQPPGAYASDGFAYDGRVDEFDCSGGHAHGPDDPCPEPDDPEDEWSEPACRHPVPMGKIITIH